MSTRFFAGDVLYSADMEHALCHMPSDISNSLCVIILPAP